MKYFLFGLLGFVAFVVALLLIAPSFIDINNYKENISAVAERYTGRKLHIEGDIKLSLFPTVNLTIHKVRLTNASWAKKPDMASISEMQVQIATVPLLLRQEVHVNTFRLIGPEIALEVGKQGQKNWEFNTGPLTQDFPVSPQQAPAAKQSPRDLPATLFFGNVGIEKGIISYRNAQENKHITVKDVNANVTLASLNDPLALSGSGEWNGEKIYAEVTLQNIQDALQSKETAFSLQFSSDLAFISYKGKVSYGETPKAQGRLEAKSGDIHKLAAWLGEPKNEASANPQALALNAALSLSDKKATLNDIELSYGDTAGIGEASVSFAKTTPLVEGDLVFSTLDLSPFMATNEKTGKQTAPVLQKPSGWSTEPVNVKGLQSFNAALRLKAEKVIVPPLSVGKSDIAVTLNKGKLTADIQEMAFYDGNIKGQVVVDASQKTPVIQKRIAMSKVKVEPWLRDMASFERLSGTLDATIDVRAQGSSQKAWVESSQGNGSVFLSNGKMKGINLAKMVQNVASAYTGVSAQEETDFSEASGTFTISQGIVSNQDLVVKAPLLHTTGSGTADLPRKYLDYTFTPKVVGTLKGSQQTAEMAGVAVPVKVEGPFSQLKYRPAAENIVKDVLSDPTQAKDKLKDLERGVRSIRDSLKLELKGD